MFSGHRRRAVAGAMLAFASCGHEARPPERPVAPRAQRPAPAPAPTPPPRPLRRRELVGVAGASYESWIANVRDCTPAEVAGAKPHLPRTQANLAGRKPAVAGDLVVDAELCRLRSPATLEAKDQLSDADYARLTSLKTKRRTQKDEPDCPTPPAPPPRTR